MKSIGRRGWLLGGCLGAGLLLALPAAPAVACGGLFCSAANPVNQAAERIIFSFDKPARKVTAVVEILYSGPAEKFAWVLPVPGIPEVGVSTSALLDRLQNMTNPTYAIQRTWGGACGTGGTGGSGGIGGSPSAPGNGSAGEPGRGPEVAVLAAGTVGPYDYEVIKVDPANSDPAMVAIMWLQANGYDVGALGPDVLRPYLRDGLNLLAFKLTKNKSAGSIRPVMLSYTTDHPMIPIRPTAVAANDDMGILVWVLGSSRAVPTNYKTLELNEALIDWFTPAMTYNDVVAAAADEAGGQGFVTELASATTGVGDSLYQERFAVEQFRRTADAAGAPELIVQVVQTFATNTFSGGFMGPFGGRGSNGRVALDGVTDVLATHLKLPAGVTIEQFMESPRCYFEQFRTPGNFYCEGKPAPTASIDLTGFDKVKFLTDFEKLVVEPLEKTTQLFRDQRYMTRFYTTMSARDMTLDPDFDLNTTLPDVSNQHSVALKYTETCPGDTSGPWEATLQNGQVVKGRDAAWPFAVKEQKMPVNLRVLQLSASGGGMVVTDNTAAIGGMLARGGGAPGAVGAGGGNSGGCSMAGMAGSTAGSAAGGVLLVLALFSVRLRRRRRAR